MSQTRSQAVRLLIGCAVFVLVSVTGCANIPDSTPAQAVANSQVPGKSPVAGPQRDADPLTLVRQFVRANADPSNGYAAARAYLATADAASWNPGESLTIIDDTFNTVPGSGQHGDSDQMVTVSGTTVGKLDSHGAFHPSSADYTASLHLRKQSDGQWRIVDPPPGVVMTRPDFNKSYHRVLVYFLQQQPLAIPVPDVRYVVNGVPDELASQVIALLLAGPSSSLGSAVRSAIPTTAITKSDVQTGSDGTLLVDLSKLGELDQDQKLAVAEQVVLSLQGVTNGGVRLEADDEPLVVGRPVWRVGDLPPSTSAVNPKAELPGLVAAGGRVSVLGGGPIPGPAGTGEYAVDSAAQSIDGSQLAMVSKTPTGQQLRVGKYGQDAAPVGISGGGLSRPTWGPGNSTSGYEVWTVVDQQQVQRAVGDGSGSWQVRGVNARALTRIGPISDLRLSRDGSRVAAVIQGKLVVAAVDRDATSVTIADPVVLASGSLTSAVSVDWVEQTSLVVATTSSSAPVVTVPVDGLEVDSYDTSNLTAPLSAVAAAPNRAVVVTDADGMWSSADPTEVWQRITGGGSEAIPCYPG